MQDFIQNHLDDWVAPVISGIVEVSEFYRSKPNSIKIKHIVFSQTEFDFLLISRRDKRRSGMRFVSRGSDLVTKLF